MVSESQPESQVEILNAVPHPMRILKLGLNTVVLTGTELGMLRLLYLGGIIEIQISDFVMT